MRIIGIDFTSRPSRRKPLTATEGRLDGDHLRIEALRTWPDFAGFESALADAGPWIAGIDFPFGQARRFVENIDWPRTWGGYVDHVASLTRPAFRSLLDDYRRDRAAGDREHRRATDIATGAISPQKLYGTPVGLMFFEGAPRLRRSGVTIPLLQQGDPDRIVVEAYPGLLARQLIGRQPYKQDTRSKQTVAQRQTRSSLIERLTAGCREGAYGLFVDIDKGSRIRMIDDPSGDLLDALLCATQAARAWRLREQNYGADDRTDPLEGWIAAPLTLSR
ncbi:MAG: DUF429 domain-containing protein [Gammaproteobacteria bacterium]|nr:DUF429 domain-containing protein [Gammaproteobacteria bacterium]